MKQSKDLITHNIPRLRRYAGVLCHGDQSMADDLVCQCIEHALGDLSHSKQSTDIRIWLFSLMHSIYVNQVSNISMRSAVDALNEKLDIPKQGLILQDLEKAVYALPPDQKEILLLVTLEDMPYRTVAMILDIPEGTVMLRLSQARQQLRRIMAGSNIPHLRRVK